jgi:hypothetical protein
MGGIEDSTFEVRSSENLELRTSNPRSSRLSRQSRVSRQTDRLFFRAVAQAGAVKKGQFNFTGGQFSGEVGA